MEVETFRETFFSGQTISSWIEVELYETTLFLVYSKQRNRDANEYTRFENVECLD